MENPQPQEANPYLTPSTTSSASFTTKYAVVPVTGGTRFLNFIIDTLVSQIGLGILIGVVLGLSGQLHFLEGPFGNWIGYPIMILYYFTMEAAIGRTIGKMLTGTIVVDGEGNKVSTGRALGRTFARFIPFDALTFLGSSSRGWHDSLTKTYVVKIKQ